MGSSGINAGTWALRGDYGQLVAAGYADDILNGNLVEKGAWQDTWLGKLDAYLRCCFSAEKDVHIVTVRGGMLCYWERTVLHGVHKDKVVEGVPVKKGEQKSLFLDPETRHRVKKITH